MRHNLVGLTAGGGGLVEGAHTAVPGALLHLHKAVLAPASAPGVLDEPVILATLATIANNQDSMVQDVDAAAVRGSIAALTGVKDTTIVVAPVTVGLDSSDNRVLQQHGLHVPFIGKPLVVHASHFEVLVVAA